MSDTELYEAIAELRQGGANTFEQIYTELNAPLFTTILRITRDRGLSEDILQEVFLKLYRSPPGPEVRNPRAYLFRMARNQALDILRSRPKDAALEELLDLPQPKPDDPGQRLDLERAFSALTLEERQLTALRLNGGLKFREIAAIMGEPLGTVLWRYRKAVEKLRILLNGGSL